MISVPAYASRVDSTWTPPAHVAGHYRAAVSGGAQVNVSLEPDGALHAAAQAMAERVAADEQHRAPAASVIQGLSWAAGVIDPLPAIVVLHASGDLPEARIREGVEDLARGQGFNRVGVGSARGADGGEVVVIALSERRLSLSAPVPRQQAPGGRVLLSGRLAEGLHDPELAITHPDGHVEHFPLGEGPDFMAQFPASARGAYQVELIAMGSGGSTVVANFPVYVGIEPPATLDAVAGTRTENVAQAEAALLMLLNEARRQAGRTPLRMNPTLAGVARAHSEDMAAHRFIAHNSPTDGSTPSQRLQRRGLSSGLILENLGRGYSAREIHDGLMASPGHRANILNADVTDVGIGVALEPGPRGGLVVTQDFIQVAPPIDVATAPAALLERINDNRRRRNTPALSAPEELQTAARDAANAFFTRERPSQQSVVDAANRAVSRYALRYRRISVLATQVTQLFQASGLEPLLDPEVRFIGIGVSQGSRPDTPPSAVFVVFILGYPRG